MNKCVIVVPVYSENLLLYEQASIRQLFKVLGQHDIAFITYRELNLTIYQNIANEYELNNLFYEYFDKKYFVSVQSYNELCLSKEFYERFRNHEYMLLYQTDAWVFRDELLDWCDKGYDYIGAPVFWKDKNDTYTYDIRGIGNGGFSLRKISYCMQMLSFPKEQKFFTAKGIMKLYLGNIRYNKEYAPFCLKIKALLVMLFKMIGIRNNIKTLFEEYYNNEDFFFGIDAQYVKGVNANIPSLDIAKKFSFEVHPELLFYNNNNMLPFGCHAFAKYDYDTFWIKYICIK